MNSVGHVFNVPIPMNFEHVENVLHEGFTGSVRRTPSFPSRAWERDNEMTSR